MSSWILLIVLGESVKWNVLGVARLRDGLSQVEIRYPQAGIEGLPPPHLSSLSSSSNKLPGVLAGTGASEGGRVCRTVDQWLPLPGSAAEISGCQTDGFHFDTSFFAGARIDGWTPGCIGLCSGDDATTWFTVQSGESVAKQKCGSLQVPLQTRLARSLSWRVARCRAVDARLSARDIRSQSSARPYLDEIDR